MTSAIEAQTDVAAAQAVAAVVLTRDRLSLLRQSLSAVLGQTRPVDRLIVVDNASSDGTREALRREFPTAEVIGLAANQGATGGFHAGIEAALETEADWLWLMDDDSVPRPSALEALLGSLAQIGDERAPALLASRVEWRQGEPHLTNLPTIAHRDPQALVDAVGRGLLPLRATTWVSLLLSREAVEREGLPRREFFYQADDIEYTARILRRGRGYFVPQSVVEHRTPTQQTSISGDVRFYYHLRNSLLMLRGRAWAPTEKPALAVWVGRSVHDYLKVNRFRPASLWNLARALRAGLGPAGA